MGGQTTETSNQVDFIKDAKTLRSRLQMELEKSEDTDMSMLSAFPVEALILHKKNGTTAEITALVDDGVIHSDDISVIVEDGDIYERALPIAIL